MIEFIIKDDNPQVLIITPLRPKDKISDETFNTIGKTNLPVHWITLQGEQNPYKNFNTALGLYLRSHKPPNYLIKVDNDIKADIVMLEMMKETLDKSSKNIAYTYCSFEFTGVIKAKFNAIPFNPEKLMIHNYISSISMMKLYDLRIIGGTVDDDKYFRLLDWALWLKFLYHGFIGKPTYNVSFEAYAGPNSISAGSAEDYKIKAQHIMEDFIVPLRLKKL